MIGEKRKPLCEIIDLASDESDLNVCNGGAGGGATTQIEKSDGGSVQPRGPKRQRRRFVGVVADETPKKEVTSAAAGEALISCETLSCVSPVSLARSRHEHVPYEVPARASYEEASTRTLSHSPPRPPPAPHPHANSSLPARTRVSHSHAANPLLHTRPCIVRKSLNLTNSRDCWRPERVPRVGGNATSNISVVPRKKEPPSSISQPFRQTSAASLRAGTAVHAHTARASAPATPPSHIQRPSRSHTLTPRAVFPIARNVETIVIDDSDSDTSDDDEIFVPLGKLSLSRRSSGSKSSSMPAVQKRNNRASAAASRRPKKRASARKTTKPAKPKKKSSPRSNNSGKNSLGTKKSSSRSSDKPTPGEGKEADDDDVEIEYLEPPLIGPEYQAECPPMLRGRERAQYLTRCREVDVRNNHRPPLDAPADWEDADYEFSHLIAKRRIKDDEAGDTLTQYLVRWKGFPPSQCTWQELPAKSSVVKAFERQFKKDLAPVRPVQKR